MTSGAAVACAHAWKQLRSCDCSSPAVDLRHGAKDSACSSITMGAGCQADSDAWPAQMPIWSAWQRPHSSCSTWRDWTWEMSRWAHAFSGVRRFEDCTASCDCIMCFRPLLPLACKLQYIRRMQVSSRGLQRLLALPALAQLSVRALTDDLDDIDEDFAEDWHGINHERHEELTAMLDELIALFA